MGACSKIKIALITGYLGSGKTTLLNHILSNDENLRVAVIVNDIGEINVDASLIQAGGFSQVDDSLIALTNGCICCTLSEDLARQLASIAQAGTFDYIVIEASGICEPIPIAYTIYSFCQDQNDRAASLPAGSSSSVLDLDNIIAVVDCARMHDEFGLGRDLFDDDIDEEDIEALLIQQLEFCTTVVLNKCDLVTPEEIAELKAQVRALQKDAVIIEATQAEVDLKELLNTGRFDFDRAINSAVWADAMEHPEEHEDPEVLEYGIETFVYKRRCPFDLERFSACVQSWGPEVIRSKGMAWISADPDMCYIFEQAGRQVSLSEAGLFIDAAPFEERLELLAQNPEFLEDWDETVGDRMTRICIIGQHLDREAMIDDLDACLVGWQRSFEL